ncbi:hypothetical protein FRC01_010383 [Tulasnella sp. 417]|nr:hypothetical protein FRC01_010383 [Tulasnella sp. 417]
MPTATDFERALAETPEICFVFDISVPRSFVKHDGWELRLNVNSSDPKSLHFTYFHHQKTSIYIHLRQGELDTIMGYKLKRVLAIAVERAKADNPNRPAIVDLRRDDSAWSSIDA